MAKGPASSVFESSRGTFYATDTCLVARRPCTLLNCRMQTDWDEHIVLRSFDDERPLCRLGALVYPAASVLNHPIENGLRFHRRGDMFSGMILANGLRRIPEKYLDGAIVPFQLIFEDEFGEEIIEDATLFVDRTAKPVQPAGRGTGLYGRRSSSELRGSVVPGPSRKIDPEPAINTGYGDALSLLKYTESREGIGAEKRQEI